VLLPALVSTMTGHRDEPAPLSPSLGLGELQGSPAEGRIPFGRHVDPFESLIRERARGGSLCGSTADA